MRGCQVEVRADVDPVVVRVVGEVDVATHAVLRSAITEAVAARPTGIVLDLAETTFMDARGIDLLLHAQELMRSIGGDLVLRSPHRMVVRLLQLCEVLEAFTLERP
jgi:anti-sigma B factor antagonist